jgi:hypothetical protein
MSEGGGFCERHGPYDAPYETCPYCALESRERRIYGPPDARPQPGTGRQSIPEDEAPARASEPDVPEGMTEFAPRAALDDELPPGMDSAPPAPIAWLIVKQPAAQRGTIIRVEPNQVIGREADIRLKDARLSRQHARLTLEPPHDAPDAPPIFHLWPFGPTNPVYINGQEARGATPLRENDEIRLGDTLFVFKVLTD